MDLRILYEYQTAELALEEYEQKLKNTATRKQLIQRQRFLQISQQKLVEMENIARVRQDKISNMQAQHKELLDQLEDLGKDISYYSSCEIEEVSVKEIQNVVKDSEKLYNDIIALKKQMTQLKQEIDKALDEIRDTWQKMRKAKAEFDELKQRHTLEIEAGNEDFEKLKKSVNEARSKVDPKLMELYQKIKGNRQNPVAILDGVRCSGCNMQLSSGIVQVVKNSDKPVECENCGRILYLSED